MSEKPLILATDVFVADTAHMTAAETGAQALLLIAAWRSLGGTLTDDDRRLAIVARVSLSAWKRMKPTVLERWTRDERGFRPPQSQFGPTPRGVLAPSLRARVLAAGQCAYCGQTEGPFEVDHVVPLSRGGADTESNLACACFACNRSKRALLVAEWIA